MNNSKLPPSVGFALLSILLALLAIALGARAESAELTLSWTDNSSTEDKFIIDRSFDGMTWLPIWEVGPDVETWTDDSVIPGVETFYRVAAENAAGRSGWTNTASATVPLAPVDPTGLGVAAAGGELINLSVRYPVSLESGPLIGSFVIVGEPVEVLIRAVGPTLDQFAVPDPLTDPVLELKTLAGDSIQTNDNWSGVDAVNAAILVGAFPLPAGSKDSVIVINLPAGEYSPTVTGAGGVSGNVLLEIYRIP